MLLKIGEIESRVWCNNQCTLHCIGLDYYDSNVDLNGDVHLGPGTHSLVVKNQGASGGKVVIEVSRD